MHQENPLKDEAVRPLTTTMARATYNWLQATSEAPHASLRLAFAISIRLRASTLPPSLLRLYKINCNNQRFTLGQHPKRFSLRIIKAARLGHPPRPARFWLLYSLSLFAHSDSSPPPLQQARGALPPRSDPFQITMTGN